MMLVKVSQNGYRYKLLICTQLITNLLTNMLLSHNKIERHKADIEKRISQLENKLKEPTRSSLLMDPSEQERNIHAIRNYVEPAEVTEIRQRNALKENRRAENSKQNIYKDSQIHPEYEHKSFQQEGKIARHVQKDPYHQPSTNWEKQYHQEKMKESAVPTSTNNNRQIYDMMNLILQNQKNLQEEISQMRSEWSKDQGKKHSRAAKAIETPFNAIESSANKGHSQVLQPEPPTYQIRNYANKKYEHSASSAKKEERQIETSSNQPSRGRALSAAKPKIVQKKPAVDLNDLIKNQKNRSDRLKVDEELKNDFWRKVDIRIRESQKQYRDTFHRNNRHEHEHLINTSDLQRKLKQDLMGKIYGQCNNKCLFK